MIGLVLAAAAASPDAATVEELRRATIAMQASIGRGDPSVYRTWLDPSLRYITENNLVWDKARFLADVQPIPAGVTATSEVQEFAATVYAGVATSTFIAQERLSYHGNPIHTRFRISDTWRRTPAGWRIVQEQVMAVLGDPPARPLPAVTLADYAGRYRLAEGLEVLIRAEGDHLVAERAGRPPATYRAEVPDLFFAPGAPRTRRVFLRDASGRVTGFADRREGEDVVWRRLP